MFDIETMCDIDKALDKSIDSITMQYQEHSIDNGIKEAVSKEEAEAIKAKLEAEGATVTIK